MSTISQSGTLPQQGGRQVVGPQGAMAPSGSAMAGAYSFNMYLQGLGNLVGAADGFAKQYQSIYNTIQTRDAQTSVSRALRTSFMDMVASEDYKGANSGKLFDAWSDKAKDVIKQVQDEHPNIPQNVFNTVSQQYMEHYFDKTGALQVERVNQYNQESKAVAVQEAVDSAAISQIGSTGAFQSVADKAKEMYPNDPLKAMQAVKNGQEQIIKAWVGQNPAAFLQWAQSGGKEFSKGLDSHAQIAFNSAVKTAEAQAKADMAFRISMDNHQHALAERAKKEQQESAATQAIKQLADGTGLPGGLFGESNIKGRGGQSLSWIDALGPEGVKKVVEVQKAITNSSMDPNFGAREQAKTDILKAASTGSDDALKLLTDGLSAGRITTSEYNFYDGIYKNAQDLKKDLPGGAMFLEAQSKVAETLLAPKSLDRLSGLMVSNAADAALYAQFHVEYLALGQRLKAQGLNSVQIAQQMNLNSPGSQASEMVAAFMRSKTEFSRTFNKNVSLAPSSAMAPANKATGSDGITIPRGPISATPGRKPLSSILGGN